MTTAEIALLQPGEMGAAVGAVLTGAGHTVRWDPTGRSPATAGRAGAAGLQAATGLVDLVDRADVVVSICPPHAALGVARAVAATGVLGGRTYLDANAVSPATATEVARIVGGAGARPVDGGIIGGPPAAGGGTRLYLSGEGAGEVAELLAGSEGGLDVIPMEDGGPTAASALKMAYAAWSKGSAALLLTARAAAGELGVGDALVAEWAHSDAGLEDRWRRAVASGRTKGWRWTGEMDEVAATLGAVGLPTGFHEAAAEVFGRA